MIFFDHPEIEYFSKKNLQTTNQTNNSIANTQGSISDKNNTVKLKTKSELKIVHQNLQCLSTSVEKFEIFLESIGNCQIACVTEHWQSQDELPLFAIKGLSLASSFCRSHGEHGGSAIYVTNDVSWKPREDLCNFSEKLHFECSAIECNFDNFDCVVLCIYRTPKVSSEIFLFKLNSILETLFNENKAIIISGDFNIDSAVESLDKHKLTSIIESYGLYVTVKDYTRVTPTSNKIYDYIITNISSNHHTKVLQSLISDHKAQIFTLSIPSRKTPYILTRLYKEENMNNFIAELNSVDWSTVYNKSSVEDKIIKFLGILDISFNKHFPLVKRKIRKTRKLDWFTPEL